MHILIKKYLMNCAKSAKMYNILYFYKLLSEYEIIAGMGRYIALCRMTMTYSSYHF